MDAFFGANFKQDCVLSGHVQEELHHFWRGRALAGVEVVEACGFFGMRGWGMIGSVYTEDGRVILGEDYIRRIVESFRIDWSSIMMPMGGTSKIGMVPPGCLCLGIRSG